MPVSRQAILRGISPKSAAGRQGVPRKIPDKNPERANKQDMQPVLSLYLHPDFQRIHMTRHISYPTLGTCSPADRHRTGRRHHPQCDVHGRLPRQYAGHSGARARHESRRRDSPAGRHRLPRQGHFVPRPVGQSPQAGALNRRSDRSGTDFAHGQQNQNRNTMYFIWYLLLGLASGWIANLIVKGNGSGLIVNLVVGLIGGVLGGWLFFVLRAGFRQARWAPGHIGHRRRGAAMDCRGHLAQENPLNPQRLWTT